MKKKIILPLVIAGFSFFILFLVCFTAVTSGITAQYAAGYHVIHSEEGTLEIEDGEIQAGVVKGKRTAYPSADNPYFFNAKYNPWAGSADKDGDVGWGYQNCTWYAYGRFGEILGRKPALPTMNAGDWYANCTAYKKGRTPKVGAVIVWRYTNGGAGHVAIVEEVKANGDIVTSNSGWSSSQKFWMETHRKANHYSKTGWIFQGFIYQPKS